MEPTQHKSNGALIGSIIIILILIIGGVYLLKNKVVEQNENNNTPDTIVPENTTPTSDNLSDIEADLNLNADVESLDSGLE